MTSDQATTADYWYGYGDRDCGEHRTVGPHRAWCFACSEWCYPDPDGACKGCQPSAMRGAPVGTVCPTCGAEKAADGQASVTNDPERT
jgi:hypothetical protein